ncbi:hypothetical protein, partial [Nocardia aurea]|uniref:hypothetical protein n=1 Tax=Nocardia aurea TaxID=2144174 RepID=UPI00339FC490
MTALNTLIEPPNGTFASTTARYTSHLTPTLPRHHPHMLWSASAPTVAEIRFPQHDVVDDRADRPYSAD